MNLRIRLIDPTGRTDYLKHDVDYYDTPWNVLAKGVMYYPHSRYTKEWRTQKAKYEIHIVRQSDRKYKMIGTLFHELTHYVISTLFKDSEKLHNWLDKNNE